VGGKWRVWVEGVGVGVGVGVEGGCWEMRGGG